MFFKIRQENMLLYKKLYINKLKQKCVIKLRKRYFTKFNIFYSVDALKHRSRFKTSN